MVKLLVMPENLGRFKRMLVYRGAAIQHVYVCVLATAGCMGSMRVKF